MGSGQIIKSLHIEIIIWEYFSEYEYILFGLLFPRHSFYIIVEDMLPIFSIFLANSSVFQNKFNNKNKLV